MIKTGFFVMLFSLSCLTVPAAATDPKLLLPHRGCYVLSATLHDLDSDLFKLSDVNPALCTYVVYGFSAIQGTQLSLTKSDEENLMICGMMRQVNPALNIFLAVDAGDAGTEKALAELSEAKARGEFVRLTVQQLRAHNADGLVLHTESLSYASANVVALLLQELREKFVEESAASKQSRLALVINVGNAAKTSRLDPQLLTGTADIIQVRSFDYHTPASEPTVTGHNSPLYRPSGPASNSPFTGSIENTFHDWEILGIPRQKLVLTIPLYGQAWRLISPLRYDPGAPAVGEASMRGRYWDVAGKLAFHDICERLPSENLTRVFDSDAMAPYAHDNISRTWVSYDDLESVRIKARWLLEGNYGGVVFWELSLEDFNGTCGMHPMGLLKGVADVFAANAKVLFEDKRMCDQSFCLKRGVGVFALGACNDSYCNCDHGGKAFTVACGPGTVFDSLTLVCNYAASMKACDGTINSKKKI
ncbi:putative Acidic mammalian chitinase [Hypsibius exemplaris]|uniref:Acidic mammalian chitinase n=1 Tax=Hypsibius exemplaris TaxID=2072580 RepID=A0A1W0WU37_HYPEX|nr:putative Acidic mammalian chitinase [Hypsibius exemplaris]